MDARRRSAAPTRDVARLYESVRTAHLERFAQMVPARIFFHHTRYDFDASILAASVRLTRVSRSGVLLRLAKERFTAIEINEPLMTGRWVDLLAQLAVVRLTDLVTRQRTRVSAYCIGLTDPAEKLHERRHVPLPIARLWSRLALRLLVRGIDRLAIGTQGAWDLLAVYVGPEALQRRARLFPALPNACACSDAGDRRPGEVLFVGAFAERKGILQLMQAWDRMKPEPSLTLRLIGTGPLLDQVQAWASDRQKVTLDIDPPREQIHAAFRRAHVVVLPSQRFGYWREQVGLPIVEALAHGCEVVTTDETGLASWLVSHGHTVVSSAEGAGRLADGISRSIAQPRTAGSVLADLPDEDSRIAADRWMLADAL